MKNYIAILSGLFFLASCNKPVNYDPGMIYTDLENKEVKFNETSAIDLNKDGIADIRFHTMLEGDPIAKQDKRKFLVTSKVDCFLPVNPDENAPLLHRGEAVPLENFAPYTWYEIAQIELAQKVIGITGDPFWEGL